MVITNAKGRKFLVRVVQCGERYGLDDCLVHESRDPMIEFYDATYAGKKGFSERGQFVSRYYARTLAERPCPGGLDLCGGVAEWKIDAPALAPVETLARQVAVYR